MKTFTYLVFIAGIMLLNACKEKDIDTYQQESRIYFRIPGEFNPSLSSDSLIYSFPFNPTVTDHDTIWFEACIMGNAEPRDREFDFRIDTEGTTAQENIDFKIVNTVVPAGAFKAKVPIVIYKTAELKNSSVRLQLSVVENQNFKAGYNNYTQAVFVWGDKFMKPANWDSSNYSSAFGSFSQVRVQFILDACNITKLPDPSNFTLMGYYNQVVRNALNEYNRGKVFADQLKDENNTPVFFSVFGAPGLG
ncbi:DUF4843 domain-containing protein [Sphingobacterium lumbrici]|uniref:DUF4843 domain-containing protein n=1 Tax=Sphingobacterium lumbrici TaxID=2559600 RepID=UPI0011284EDA|nr:DUF4843 domain-containing protein [Sphingobacterium lumbrici]